MKNFTVLILLFLNPILLLTSKAQMNESYYWMTPVSNLTRIASFYNKPEVSEVKITSITDKKSRTRILKFNEDQLIHEHYYGKTGDSIEKKAVFTYDGKKQIKNARFYRKHKLREIYECTFNETGKITQVDKKDEEGELKMQRIIKFNSNGDIEESTLSFKKTGEINSTWKYEYYEKGKLSHTYYYKKDKLKRQWDYMCKEDGVEITKKNVFNVCEFHETKDDTLTKIFQSTDNKGKIWKSVYKYTAKDTLPLIELHYNQDNNLSSKFTFDKSSEKMLSRIYYRKGKVKSEYTQVFSGDNMTSVTYKNNGKIKYSEEKTYNEKGYLTDSKYYGKNGKYKGESVIEYTFR